MVKGTVLTKGTRSPASLAHSSVTSAPRSIQALATAQPILPVEWLVMYRTGSIGSQVAPAETTTFIPCISFVQASSRRQ